MLDLSRSTAVIIGGGAVAARKAQGLLNAGAAVVRCIAPSFCTEMPDLVQRVQSTYRAGFLEGAALVFAATNDPSVNDQVVCDAQARSIMVNRADSDDGHPGDFIVPAIHASGTVTVAVSAGSPALSSLIRDRIAQSFDPRWEQMARLMHELRPSIKSALIDIASRRSVFRDLATEQAIRILADQGPEGLKRWLYEKHPELTHA